MLWIGVAAAVLLLVSLGLLWHKGRQFAPGTVFRASRLSTGNRIFPTQVLISPTSVVHFTPRWFGQSEQSIHMAHVASVRIETGLMFSDVLIETTGGEAPIHCRGHLKGDAVRMKQAIEHHQSAYYQSDGSAGPDGTVRLPPSRR